MTYCSLRTRKAVCWRRSWESGTRTEASNLAKPTSVSPFSTTTLPQTTNIIASAMFGRTLRPLRKIFTRAIGTSGFVSATNATNGKKYLGAAAVAAGVVAMYGAMPLSTTTALSQPAPVLRELYPEIQPYESADIKVSDIHTVHYELYGNPEGKPVLFVHGGPGGGTSPKVWFSFPCISHQLSTVDGSIL
jgi:hypothetical protein